VKVGLAGTTAGELIAATTTPPFRTDVFVSGRDGYHTYRIPAIVVTNEGTLLAFCEGRKSSSSDHGDVDLVMKRSENNGETWLEQQVVYEKGRTDDITIGNPCPVVDGQTGIIWLPFCEDNNDVFITHSEDGGKTWVSPRKITSDVKDPEWGWYATGPGVGIQIQHGAKSGRLVIPCNHSVNRKRPGDNNYFSFKHSHVFYSDDHGKSWTLGASAAAGTNESQVVELTDGRLMLNMRNYNKTDGGKMRAVACSEDFGESWGKLQFDPTLIEPVCQASILRYSWPEDGQKSRILFSNPADREERVRMTVRLSYDEGRTWPVKRIVHPERCEYSCLTVLQDSTIGLLFKGDRKIMFVRFSLPWLAGDDSL